MNTGFNRIYREATERVVIFTSTADFKNIYDFLNDLGNECYVVIPENRIGTDKVQEIENICRSNSMTHRVHPRNEEELIVFHQWLAEIRATIAVSWNYSQILKKKTLDMFSKGAWNMHGGKVPQYRGANVLQWAIINGETEAGVTWHMMDEKIDHGLILKQGTVRIEKNDTAIEVIQKIGTKGFELFCELWEEAGTDGILPYAVDMESGCYWRARKPLDGIIRSDMTETQIRDLLRAQCPPWPAPFVAYQNKVFRAHEIAGNVGAGVISYRNKVCSVLLRVSEETNKDLIQAVLEKSRDGN